MRWTVHGERSVYESEWVSMHLADVELPDGRRFDYHVVRNPRGAASVVAFDPARGVLMLWRHRFITDTWGWEVPAGGLDDDETAEQAAEREMLEETGWRPGPLEQLGKYYPSNGRSDERFHVFVARGAVKVGEPVDTSEAERVEWVTVDDLRGHITAGRIADGFSLTSVLWALAAGAIR
jgi:8-oxo-dGTP pyrophosphatase MutT (NUDIX family)